MASMVSVMDEILVIDAVELSEWDTTLRSARPARLENKEFMFIIIRPTPQRTPLSRFPARSFLIRTRISTHRKPAWTIRCIHPGKSNWPRKGTEGTKATTNCGGRDIHRMCDGAPNSSFRLVPRCGLQFPVRFFPPRLPLLAPVQSEGILTVNARSLGDSRCAIGFACVEGYAFTYYSHHNERHNSLRRLG